MANLQNFSLTAGEDKTLSLTARSSSGAILSLTSAGITWRLVNRFGVTVLNKTGTVVSASAGTFTVALTDADTAGLPDGTYAHEALVTISGVTTAAVKGRVISTGQKSLVSAAGGVSADSASSDNFYDTATAAAAANVKSDVPWIWTAGGTSIGDGNGGLFVRTGTQPGHSLYFSPANGGYFERAPWGNQGGTRGFYTTDANGANIWKFGDRVFIDGAYAFGGSGGANDTGTSWLDSDTDGPYFVARDASLLSMSSKGWIAVSGVSRSSDASDLLHACIGVSGTVNNDKSSGAAWGLYSDIVRQSGSAATFGLEVAAKNRAADTTQNPYQLTNGCHGLWMAGGGDSAYGGSPANPSDTALTILSNSSTWNRGIVFEDEALTGTDGVTGTAVAISLAKGHRILWYYAGGNLGAGIRSDVNSASANSELVFDNSITYLVGYNSKVYWAAQQATNQVNYANTKGSATGVAVEFQAQGDDTNIDLKLTPKGSGVVSFGTHAALGAETVTGYITIKDAGGTSRKIAVVS